MKTFMVVCEGVTPIMMHRVSDDLLIQLRNRTPKPQKTDWTFEQEAEAKIHKNEDGRPGIPVEMLMACLIAGGRLVKFDNKKNLSTLDSSLIPGLITIQEQFLIFPAETKWIVDKRAGRNPGDGSLICLIRPKFPKWSFTVTLEIDDSKIQPEKIKLVFQNAGQIVGLGSFRPSCKGQFGQFKIKEWEEISE